MQEEFEFEGICSGTERLELDCDVCKCLPFIEDTGCAERKTCIGHFKGVSLLRDSLKDLP